MTENGISRDRGDGRRYLFGDPSWPGLATLWGLTVVRSSAIPAGQAIVADWTKATLAIREDTTVAWAEAHGDLFVKNQLVVRVESRVAFAVAQPSAFCLVDLAAWCNGPADAGQPPSAKTRCRSSRLLAGGPSGPRHRAVEALLDRDEAVRNPRLPPSLAAFSAFEQGTDGSMPAHLAAVPQGASKEELAGMVERGWLSCRVVAGSVWVRAAAVSRVR